MRGRFYDAGFTEATLTKLRLFRHYLRNALPVFIKEGQKHPNSIRELNIFDLFAGPGKDAHGEPGSPLIILEELELAIESYSVNGRIGPSISIHFNDADETNITRLKACVAERYPGAKPYSIRYSHREFRQELPRHTSKMKHPASANIVWLDQFSAIGITREDVSLFAMFSKTDILFFIPSSYISRFRTDSSICKPLGLLPADMEGVPHADCHRFICSHFRKALPVGAEYFLSPFSLKKNANIHGLIFGSSKLKGLEAFLKACWNIDRDIGEANFDIDRDEIQEDQPFLFPELGVPKKWDVFKHELENHIRKGGVDNRSLYRFCLEQGFLPSGVSERILRPMQQEGVLKVWDLTENAPARKSSFYLSYRNYQSSPRVLFSIQGSGNEKQQDRVD